MKQRNTWSTGALILVAVVYCVVYSALKHNLAATAAALAAQPVTVVIDAGHGGEDGGAVSVTGVLESGLNLAIAGRLEQVLAFCGVQTSMIRSGDQSVSSEGDTVTARKVADLKQRVRMVNAVQNAVLISIHQNHFSESKYDGAQVFYARTEGSRALAQQTQSVLRETLDPENHREVKAADSVYLMEKLQCTGILVECGFLSNPQEDRLLQQEAYQKKIACAIGAALVQYLEKGDESFEV